MASFQSFDGLTLHYQREGEGLPVLLLHGLTSSTAGNWQRPGIWQALVDSGREVIGLDARGHGRSAKPHEPDAYRGHAMARDVDALLRHLGVTRLDVAGYSMGAMTALRFAVAEPRLRRLVLGGIGGNPDEWGSPDTQAARAERADRMLAGVEAVDPDALSDPFSKRVRRLMEERDNDLEAMAAILRARLSLGADIDLKQVTAPTLVVCGDADAPAAPLAAALPNSRSHTLTGGHEGVVSDPELAKVIVAFLNELDDD